MGLLQKWFEGSEYEYILSDYLKTHTYDNLLHLKIRVPVGEDDERAFLIDTPTEVKDIMSYLYFASRANPYINYTIKNVKDQIKNNKNQETNKYFLQRTQNFSSQYNYFMKSLNGEDTMMSDLTKLLLAKTAMTLVDTLKVTYTSGEVEYIVIHPDAETYDSFIETHQKDIVNVIPIKDYRYITDLYAASLDQSPEYYDNLYYYIMSGGDTSYLNSFQQKSLKDYLLIIKETKTLFKIKAGDFDNKDAIDLGFDSLSFFADRYNWNSSSTIEDGKEAWENVSDTYDLLSAVLDCSLVGALTTTYKISNDYIDEVKKVYENAQGVENGWYALTYFYLSQNNQPLLKAIIDSETGSAEFDFNRWVSYGFPVHHDDPIEENLCRYYEKNSYVAHTYTPDYNYRMYLMKTCNDMYKIQKIDPDKYKNALLDYIIASINYENGLVGVPFYVSVSSNDTTLGSVSESKFYIANSSVSIEANPYENVTFAGWYDKNTGDIISTDRKFTFNVHDNMNLQAKFVSGQFAVAKKPIIQEQPVGASCYAGETPNSINISATTTDAGTLRIDWYYNTQNTNQGGNYVSSGESVLPFTDAVGTFYYYAVVNNTITSKVGLEEKEKPVSVRSNPVRIEVKKPFLDRIKVILPEKRQYDLNDQIDTTGMIVTAHYSNGDTKEITDYVVNYDFSTSGSHIVNVIYDGKISSFEVDVVSHVLPGDVNYDGQVTVSDAIMLQKWLLCISNSLTCSENADLCEDNIIDIYDLALLRRMLLDSRQ